jgi:hypothetical protein
MQKMRPGGCLRAPHDACPGATLLEDHGRLTGLLLIYRAWRPVWRSEVRAARQVEAAACGGVHGEARGRWRGAAEVASEAVRMLMRAAGSSAPRARARVCVCARARDGEHCTVLLRKFRSTIVCLDYLTLVCPV